MKFSKIFILSLSLVMLAPSALEAKKKSSLNQEVNINFKDLQINDFVKLVSNILQKNILIQAPIPGKVDFVSTRPVYQKDLPMILQSVLGSKGYSLVDRGSFLEIVRSKDATKYNLPIVKNLGENYMQMVTKILPVHGMNVDLIASKIKHLGSSGSSIITIKSSNSILITDFEKNIKTIQNIIRKIERSEDVKIEFFKLRNTKVDYAYSTILNVVKSRFNSRIATDKVTIAADKTGNAIIATGSSKNLRILRKIIEEFDKEDAIKLKQTAVIPLKNTEAKDILKVLTQLIKAKLKTNPSGVPTVVSEPNTNAIVVSGTSDDINEIKGILQDLDKEQMQVYVKARIIEVSQDKSSKIGAKYGLQAGKSNSSGLYTMAMNMGGSSLAFAPSALGIEMPELKSGLALGASIDFLTTTGAAKVVSEPSILCLNNKESKIYVGQTQSIATSTKTKDSKVDYSTNTYTREDIGLTLKIKPRISNDGKVTLEAETTIEDVVNASSEQVGMPTTTKRQVSTKAIVKNGESVIVGGLIRDKNSQAQNKVPLLGDIPLLGRLFQNNVDSADDVNLVIVLTPYIINTSDDLTDLRQKLVQLNELQATFSKEFEKNLKKRRFHSQQEDEEDEEKTDTSTRHEEILKKLRKRRD